MKELFFMRPCWVIPPGFHKKFLKPILKSVLAVILAVISFDEPQSEKMYLSPKYKKWFFPEKWLYKSKLLSGRVWLQCDDGKWLKYTNMYKGVIYCTSVLFILLTQHSF